MSSFSINRPKVVTAFMYIPNKNYYLLNIEIKQRVGDLAAVSKVLAEAHVGILNGSFSAGFGGRPGSWQIFVDPQNPGTTGEQLRHIVLSIPDVASCQVKQSRDGLLVDELSFPIIVSSGQRAMILRTDIFNGMLQATRQKFGSGADVIIYDQGVSAGKITGKELLSALGKEKISSLVDQIIGMYQSLGWGVASVKKFTRSPLELVIRMSESAECSGQESAKPISHFLRGHMVGVVGGIFGVDTSCTESNCLATGDPYCEFQLRQKQ